MLFKVAIDASLGPVYMFCFYKTNKKICKSDCLPKKLEKKKKIRLRWKKWESGEVYIPTSLSFL